MYTTKYWGLIAPEVILSIKGSTAVKAGDRPNTANHFWGRAEKQVLGLNLSLHLIITLAGLLFMPFAYFSELSLHDGTTYFEISQNLWPIEPITLLSWQKRILLPFMANIVFPWDRQVAFWLLGIIPASLSAVYFYKIARWYTPHALKLTWIYSCLPWLVFSAHHSLNEPLMMLFLLAGYYYNLENRPGIYILCYALAVLSKETALLAVGAQAVILLWRDGWKRAIWFSLAIMPFALFCAVYGLHWRNCLWCLQVEPQNRVSLIPGLWWMWRTFWDLPPSSANPLVSVLYNAFNQILNLGVLIIVAAGIFRLRKVDRTLMVYCAILSIPIYFLGPYVYSLNVNLGRQFLISSLVLIGYADLFDFFDGARKPFFARLVTHPLVAGASLVGMLSLAFLWIVMYAKFFLFHKFF